jgi:hypothetical protein
LIYRAGKNLASKIDAARVIGDLAMAVSDLVPVGHSNFEVVETPV